MECYNVCAMVVQTFQPPLAVLGSSPVIANLTILTRRSLGFASVSRNRDRASEREREGGGSEGGREGGREREKERREKETARDRERERRETERESERRGNDSALATLAWAPRHIFCTRRTWWANS